MTKEGLKRVMAVIAQEREEGDSDSSILMDIAWELDQFVCTDEYCHVECGV